MTFLASFLKTETLVMENYCPNATAPFPIIQAYAHEFQDLELTLMVISAMPVLM